ncbi:MAG: galactokinase [Phycisphaeraceae bacterium]
MNIEALKKNFEDVFSIAASVIASAPGRLEVLGNHTDYNAGLTLSCAVDFRCYVAITRLDQPIAKLASTAFDSKPESFSLDQPDAPQGHWAKYVLGLVEGLKRRGHVVPGFAALVDSQVPRSAGVSSSAALEIAVLTGLVNLMGIEISPDEMARIGQEAESQAVGAQTGLLDQFSSLLGERDQMLQIDFQSMQTQSSPAPPGWCFVAIDSGIKHDLTKEYNARRASCEAAAKATGVDSLRMLNAEQLLAHHAAMNEDAFKCALHIIGENLRVRQAIERLAVNDIAGFGQLLLLSHKSSQSNFKNSCPELDELVAFAEADDRCLGARLSGGGFGGISIHLVSIENAEAYRSDILNAIKPSETATRWSAICEIGDGAKTHE